MRFIKKIIHNLLRFFGYEILSLKYKQFEKTWPKILVKKSQNILIFDVGANAGQSITKYLKIFPSATIHSFEPVEKECKKILKKFQVNKNIIINNCAVGEKNDKKEFYIAAGTTHSSFHKILPDTTWLKKRSKQKNINQNEYMKEKKVVSVKTLDNYALDKKIKFIDILKIDTQGYENKVLEGSKNLLENKKIHYIQLELIFSDIYEKKIFFYDVEKYLIPNGYELFSLSNPGNLHDDFVFQVEAVYYHPKLT